jgi:SAM-dependent methyltransferase
MVDDIDVRAYNRDAWDRQVRAGDRWTIPVTPEQVARAREGDWSVVLTPTKAVPRAWFGTLDGARLLGLASGGGQQCPLFAAAGARVTVFDNSPAQLARDREVAERDGLDIECIEGDMADLSRFGDGSFDLVFHPVSNCFVPDVRPVWREVARVLRPGGALLAGVINPVAFLFDEAAARNQQLQVRHALPYSDLTSLEPAERAALFEGEPLTFGHTLTDQIGAQLDAGLTLTGLYEDTWGGEHPLDAFAPAFIATRAVRVSSHSTQGVSSTSS